MTEQIKLCECQCGQPTLREYEGSKRTGPYLRFIHGHQGLRNGIQSGKTYNSPARKLRRFISRALSIFGKSHSEKCREGWTPEARARVGAKIRKLSKTRKYKAAKSAGIKAAWARGAFDTAAAHEAHRQNGIRVGNLPKKPQSTLQELFDGWKATCKYPNRKVCKRNHPICVENANRADLRREGRYTCRLCMKEYPSNQKLATHVETGNYSTSTSITA